MSDGYRVISYSGHDPHIDPYRGTLYKDFVHTLRAGNDWFKLIDDDAYYQTYKKVMPMLLSRADTSVRLACLADALDVCIGWAVLEGEKLHYVFVRKDFRRQGIGTELLPKEITTITHLTWHGQLFRNKRFPQSKFNPFD